MNTAHLSALNVRLSNEKVRLANAKTARERDLRAVWVAQIEKEIAHERALQVFVEDPALQMTDDELLEALS